MNLNCFYYAQTINVIGDRGLEVLARSCKRLRRLRIKRDVDEDEDCLVSQRGLTALAQGCLELEYLAVYVSDITNASLEYIGTYSKNLSDFRLFLLDQEETITDLPLDNGVQALLRGCQKLRRFALYLRSGGLTDLGLSYVGQYSQNVRWMLLGYVGESDAGLLEFSKGCPSLQELEMRGCCFRERALVDAVMQLTSLRYLWVRGTQYLLLVATFWQWLARFGISSCFLPEELMFLISRGRHIHPHILAYYSLAEPRTDFPHTLIR
ncbi:hypothetical protein C1H46_041122 [Malus baccata]|uniref:Transport inhibitor response 1 domain-containing protein n=1 Tax=Malus baccata TaxID=106549 RepID=A0A540KH51_MALBA|nr:hypothetical protein C1H46_041122 [Malus baccata]